jgi:hypothetical protein
MMPQLVKIVHKNSMFRVGLDQRMWSCQGTWDKVEKKERYLNKMPLLTGPMAVAQEVKAPEEEVSDIGLIGSSLTLWKVGTKHDTVT